MRNRKSTKNEFNSSMLRAYADLYLDNVEEGKISEAVTPDCIARIFKTFMTSNDKQSNKVLNSLIGGLS